MPVMTLNGFVSVPAENSPAQLGAICVPVSESATMAAVVEKHVDPSGTHALGMSSPVS